jgi:hypothetical protein
MHEPSENSGDHPRPLMNPEGSIIALLCEEEIKGW